MIIKKEKLVEALQKISSMFFEQIEHGKQTKIVKAHRDIYYSLGQFLKDLERTQRGVHGTATGLRVIADSDKNDVINGMVRYLENRLNVEQAIIDKKVKIDIEKLTRDDNNTIKLSESLYSLYYVKSASSQKENYIGRIKNKLEKGVIKKGNNTGWDYYLDEEEQAIEILPTAFAILALGIHGFPVIDQVTYLRNRMKSEELNDPAKFAESIFSLYALIVGSNDFENNESVYREILNKIWNSSYRVMNNLIEQNIEYWFETQHDYVRIPWQIYLLSITSKISDKKFYSVSSQRLLNKIITDVINNSFKYQYSGYYISSRTNGILYDTLVQIKQNIKGNLWHKILIWVDILRTFLGSKVIRYFLIIVGIAVLLKSIVDWYMLFNQGEKNFSDIAPEFIGAIVLSLIALGKKK